MQYPLQEKIGNPDNFEYPKSRKLLMTSDNEIQNVFGWVKARFEF